MKRLLFLLLFLNSIVSHSQDLMSGEISFSHISGNTYEINGLIYAQKSTAIPRTYFMIDAGDGNGTIPVSASVDSSGVLIYFLSLECTYPGPGIYNVSIEGDFLVDSIVNLPNSVHQPLYLSTELDINPFAGSDDCPIFTQPLVDHGKQDSLFIYNPGAYDPDGDSLSYSLIAVDSGYSFAGASIDSITGDITINNPSSGRYLFGIKVTQWRNINSTPVELGYVKNVLFFYFEGATGIKEVTDGEILNLSPNPATDHLTVYTSSLKDEHATISIMNILGQEASPPAPLHIERWDALIDPVEYSSYGIDVRSLQQAFIFFN